MFRPTFKEGRKAHIQTKNKLIDLNHENRTHAQIRAYKEMGKHRESNVAHLDMRRKLIETQNIAHYKNEYDRIHGHISNNTISALQKEVYKDRQAKLKEWAHFTVHPEVHELFQKLIN